MEEERNIVSKLPLNLKQKCEGWIPVENRSEKTGTKLENTGISGENWADLGKKGTDSG
jgi:hypothetical protein